MKSELREVLQQAQAIEQALALKIVQVWADVVLPVLSARSLSLTESAWFAQKPSGV
jgi:hypothetical protein